MNKFITLFRPLISRFPKLALIYRSIRDGWLVDEEPPDTPMGFKMAGSGRIQAMQEGNFEPEETQIAKKLLPHVDVFINIGANIGYYCCIALSYQKYVVAFEPLALNLRYLLQNIKANNWESRIEVFPLALSNKVGIIELYGGSTGASIIEEWPYAWDETTLVPSSTLDNVLGSRFQSDRCLIIVDIEGAEKLMLDGAASWINRDLKPIWMVEIWINTEPALSIFQAFWDSGYEAWTADEQCRAVQSDEVKHIIKGGKNTLQTHNFLFIETGRKAELLDT
jgi:FkbM family methyltransferase